jgi:hypothetical protein
MGQNLRVLFLALGGLGVSAHAQAVPANGPGSLQMMSGKHLGIGGFEMYTQGEPFQLVERQTTVRTLPDGTEGTSQMVRHVFRDAQARFRLESGVMKDGVFEATNITIVDPVALTSVSFGPHGTKGRLTHMEPRQLPTAEDERKAAEQAARSAAYDKAHPEDFSEESLGTRVIAGEKAVGTRKKQLFVATNGKDRFSLVTETWTSPELKIALLTVSDYSSSKLGMVTTEVTELTRTEPDPALFKAPAGLTLEEQVRR